ncbi:hypothetical protein Micbo1qcDRAFT_162619 [Microdochium bolleyi]|uniref:Uncharacterized protein n=1 Tax=Microdochium bolleyi TaxID=196109 RepID=A0A136J5J2_9PEZI|nr:hypothetical protein Micbo1qcDRAFT_162619 [Microdochium bolleyi]
MNGRPSVFTSQVCSLCARPRRRPLRSRSPHPCPSSAGLDSSARQATSYAVCYLLLLPIHHSSVAIPPPKEPVFADISL